MTIADHAKRVLEAHGRPMPLERLCERLQRFCIPGSQPGNRTPENVARALRDDESFTVERWVRYESR